MNEGILVAISQIVIGATALTTLGIVLTASWYDLKAIARSKIILAASTRLRSSNQPSILILVYADNSESAIIACLQSIKKNRYQHCQVVVCDNASNDATVRLARAYKRRNKKLITTIYATKIPLTREGLLQDAHKKAKMHDLVMVIEAADILPPRILKLSAAYFYTNGQLATLRFRRYIASSMNIAMLFRQYVDMSINLLHKATSRFSVLDNSYRMHPAMFRDAFLRHADSPTSRDVTYASSLLVTTSISAKRSQMIGRYSLLALVGCACGILLFSYFFYTAATLRSNTLLTFSWLLVSLWLLAVVWSDDTLSALKKIELMMTVPFMYFILYVQLIAYVISNAWHLLSALRIPQTDFKSIQTAILQEAYSLRF